MESKPCWEANSRSAGQEVLRHLCSMKVHHRVRNSPSLDSFLSQMNPVLTYPTPSTFLACPMRTKCPSHSSSLYHPINIWGNPQFWKFSKKRHCKMSAMLEEQLVTNTRKTKHFDASLCRQIFAISTVADLAQWPAWCWRTAWSCPIYGYKAARWTDSYCQWRSCRGQANQGTGRYYRNKERWNGIAKGGRSHKMRSNRNENDGKKGRNKWNSIIKKKITKQGVEIWDGKNE